MALFVGGTQVKQGGAQASKGGAAGGDNLSDPLGASEMGDALQADTGDVNPHHMSVASDGTSGSGSPLPHKDKISASFGRHDVSGVRAHTDGHAAKAADSMGAKGFAIGQDVGFSGSPDLHTAAHEAAHVMQQQHGVQLDGGVGKPGDVYEKHADAVADAVVSGQSAEPLLDSMPGGGGGQTEAVQHVLVIGGTLMNDDTDTEMTDEEYQSESLMDGGYVSIKGGDKVTDTDAAWKKVLPFIGEEFDKTARNAMKARLKKWINREAERDVRSTTGLIAIGLGARSDDRRYRSYEELATALKGEQEAKANKVKELKLAKDIQGNPNLQEDLSSAMMRVYAWIEENALKVDSDFWEKLAGNKGKFQYYHKKMDPKAALQKPDKSKVAPNFTLIHDVMWFLMRETKVIDGFSGRSKRGHVHKKGEEEQVAYVGATPFEKDGQHSMIESNPFVEAARSRKLPLGAGASNTTQVLMKFAAQVKMPPNEKSALAWAAFSFWNSEFKQVQATRHTFHEIMDVANLETDGEVEYDLDAQDVYDVGYNKKKPKSNSKSIKEVKPKQLKEENGKSLKSVKLDQKEWSAFKQSKSFESIDETKALKFTRIDLFVLAAEIGMEANSVLAAWGNWATKLMFGRVIDGKTMAPVAKTGDYRAVMSGYELVGLLESPEAQKTLSMIAGFDLSSDMERLGRFMTEGTVLPGDVALSGEKIGGLAEVSDPRKDLGDDETLGLFALGHQGDRKFGLIASAAGMRISELASLVGAAGLAVAKEKGLIKEDKPKEQVPKQKDDSSQQITKTEVHEETREESEERTRKHWENKVIKAIKGGQTDFPEHVIQQTGKTLEELMKLAA